MHYTELISVNKEFSSGISFIINTKLAYSQSFEITNQKNLFHEKTPIRAKYWSIV